jgi:peroxiredoxin family protein
MTAQRPEKLSIVVFSGEFDKIHYALVMASAAAAIDIPATLFFTMGASRALLAEPSWRNLPAGEIGGAGELAGDVDDGFKERTVADFEDLLQACTSLGVKFMVCDMGLRAMDLEGALLREDIPIETGGMVTFLGDAKARGQMVFI